MELVLLSTALAGFAAFFGALWMLPVWDRVSGQYVADLTPRMHDLGLDEATAREMMRWWGLTLLLVGTVFGIVFAMPPVAAGLLALVWIAPRYMLDDMIAKRRIVLRDQLVRAVVGLANAARAGVSLPQGLEIVAADTPEPLAAELRRIVSDYQAGRPLPTTLRETAERLSLEPFSIFVNSILVCLERGGKVTFALERIAEGLQELQRLERKLEADTANGRRVALLMGLFPLFFLAGFTMLDPQSMGYLYTTFVGQLVLLGVGALVFFSVLWCKKIMSLDF